MLNAIIDWFQTTFPPNRIAILLAGVITAVSGSIAAWLATHFPGLSLGAAEIAGVLGAAVLITIRLLDRWLDQWQRGENIDAAADVEAAFNELGESPEMEALINSLGTLEEIGQAVAELRKRVESPDGLTEADIIDALEEIAEKTAGPAPEPINAGVEEEAPPHHPV